MDFFSLGILEESLQQYGSLIPIHVDDVVEKLQDIFNESFLQPHRSDTVSALTHYRNQVTFGFLEYADFPNCKR